MSAGIPWTGAAWSRSPHPPAAGPHASVARVCRRAAAAVPHRARPGHRIRRGLLLWLALCAGGLALASGWVSGTPLLGVLSAPAFLFTLMADHRGRLTIATVTENRKEN